MVQDLRLQARVDLAQRETPEKCLRPVRCAGT